MRSLHIPEFITQAGDNEDWARDARCKQKPELFDRDVPDPLDRSESARRELAKAMCRSCPVNVECLLTYVSETRIKVKNDGKVSPHPAQTWAGADSRRESLLKTLKKEMSHYREGEQNLQAARRVLGKLIMGEK